MANVDDMTSNLGKQVSTMGNSLQNNWEKFREHPKRWITLLFSIYCGWFGMDRLYIHGWKSWIGKTKLFTFGGFGIWYLVDIFIQLGECWAKKETTCFRSDLTFEPADIQTSFFLASLNAIFFFIVIPFVGYILYLLATCNNKKDDKDNV